MANGATIWARKTIDSEVFYNKPDKWFKIWFYIVNKVNHKKHQSFCRSEGYMTNDQICAATKATIDQTKKCLCYLRRMGMIRTTRSTRGFTIKVLAYNKYQDLSLYSSTARSTRKAPEKHQRGTTINKNEKNDNNKKLYKKDLNISLVDESTKQKRKSSAKKKKEYELLGEFKNIKLTKEEQVRLKGKYGSQATDRAITEMSIWLKQNNKTYKDYYAALLGWARRSEEKANPPKLRPNTPMYDDYDA